MNLNDLERQLRELPAWQRDIFERLVMHGPTPAFSIATPMRWGRRGSTLLAIKGVAALGGHIHAAFADGSYHVEMTDLGVLLYVPLPPVASGYEATLAVFDEPWMPDAP